ncbi:TetR/AcrR family transcriptional regulator [Xanthobacter sp. 126]|uniref:TetR/AcrR family transcriptional regulator n=1 Tax=Xanthobacter sp. 126 TaxID=1131814 RepID=UPI00045EB529|nr:TetR/AcrR family transcriptional regulator [Xanthobacter sp. 126]
MKRGVVASDSRPRGPASANPAANPAAKIARPRGGRPTKQAAEELGQRILDTAARLFSSQGFAATTMEQVAAECGAGKDTIYRRYPSKAALFTALMDQLRTRVMAEIDAAMGVDGAPLERLRTYARTLLSINMRPELLALNRVALAEAVPAGGVGTPTAAEDPFMVRFADLVRSAQSKGLVVAGDSLFIADQLLYATSIKPMIRAMLGDSQFTDLASQDLYFGQAWDLAMAGIVRKPNLSSSDH